MAPLNILLAIFLWSSQGVVVRLAGVSVHILIFYSCVVSVIVQGTILGLKGYKKKVPEIKLLKYPFILGVIGFLNMFTYYYAFKHTTIANAVMTHYTAPVIVAFLAPVFLKENISRRTILAIMIASTGLYIMLNGFLFNESQAAGIMAGLASGLAYALIIILARVYTQDIDPLVLTFFSNAVIALIIAPFVREFPFHAAWVIVLTGIVYSTIAPILYYRGLKYVTADRAAVLGYLEPLGAIGFSMLFLNEWPGMVSIAGGILIIISGYITLMKPQ